MHGLARKTKTCTCKLMNFGQQVTRSFFKEKVSGAKADRSELMKLLEHVREGDTVMVWELDRLGRSLKHLVETVNILKERGVGFRSLKEAIGMTTATGKLICRIFGSFAEFECDMLRERQMPGHRPPEPEDGPEADTLGSLPNC